MSAASSQLEEILITLERTYLPLPALTTRIVALEQQIAAIWMLNPGTSAPPPSYQVCVTAQESCTPHTVISGATVTITLGMTTIGTCTTDGTGMCCVSVPTTGTYTISVALTGYTTGTGSATVSSPGTTSQTISLVGSGIFGYAGSNLNLNVGGNNYTLFYSGHAGGLYTWVTNSGLNPNTRPYAAHFSTPNGVATYNATTHSCTTLGTGTASFSASFSVNDSTACCSLAILWFSTSCSGLGSCGALIDDSVTYTSFAGPNSFVESAGVLQSFPLDVVFPVPTSGSSGLCRTPVPFGGTNATVTP